MQDLVFSPLLMPAVLIVITIGLAAFGIVPEYLAALMFFTAAMILKVAAPATIFTGFGSSAFWLVLSGYVLGAAIRGVGLADRVANALAQRLSVSWAHMVGGVVAVTYGLAFVMPSNVGRIALFMPIVMALAEKAKIAAGSPGRTGLALLVGVGTFQLSASVLPANVPNLVLQGAAESGFGVHFSYVSYLVLHAPILGVAKGILLCACVYLLFPARPVIFESEESQPLSPKEVRLAALLAVTLFLWLTDFLHGISPAWIGLASACVCLLPAIGFVSANDFSENVNLRACLYIAGILGIAALTTESGLGAFVGEKLLLVLPINLAHPAASFGSLIALTSVLTLLVTANGVPGLFVPLGGILSGASGFPIETVLMVHVIGYATPVLPYQASPIVIAMAMGGVSAKDGTKLCALLAMISFVTLVPLDYYWFRLLGWIP